MTHAALLRPCQAEVGQAFIHLENARALALPQRSRPLNHAPFHMQIPLTSQSQCSAEPRELFTSEGARYCFSHEPHIESVELKEVVGGLPSAPKVWFPYRNCRVHGSWDLQVPGGSSGRHCPVNYGHGYFIVASSCQPLTVTRIAQGTKNQARAPRTHVRLCYWSNTGTRPGPLVTFN